MPRAIVKIRKVAGSLVISMPPKILVAGSLQEGDQVELNPLISGGVVVRRLDGYNDLEILREVITVFKDKKLNQGDRVKINRLKKLVDKLNFYEKGRIEC